MRITSSLSIFLTGLLITCQLPAQNIIGSLKYLGGYNLPHRMQFQGTTVGGLSGIDYDRKQDVYYVLSDDRSSHNPVRFYTMKVGVSTKGIDTVIVKSVTYLRQQDGTTYPESSAGNTTPDPESIRYIPSTNQIVWSSEGDRKVSAKPPVLIQPAITTSTLSGEWVSAYQLPDNLRIEAAEKGPRQNGVLEGLSFSHQYQKLWAALEEPRYEDGPRADLTPTASWVRFYQFDATSRKCQAQYAYALEPIAHPALIAGTFKVNGVSEILAVNDKTLLVMERSFSTGRLACTIRIYVADVSGAQDVSENNSLTATAPTRPVAKKLLLNLDDLGIYTDNMEGMTWGPDLPNGHHTLVMVADDNFLPHEKSQFLLFEVLPNP